ncbi:MAG: hypothetical protein EXS38_02110 [Opitutus sp.]|nr:hypothetical protein [Opitutus sp.]
MNDKFLQSKIREVAQRYLWVGFWRKLAACWAAATLVGLGVILFQRTTGWTSPLVLPSFAALAAAVATGLALLHFEKRPDDRWVARKIEDRFPALNGVLLTAVQQTSAPGEAQGYFQARVIDDAIARGEQQDWRTVVPAARLVGMQVIHLVALGSFIFALSGLRIDPVMGEAAHWTGVDGMTLTPGDTSIERGDSLVVLARFGGRLPPAVNLVLRENGAAARSIPLVKSLADPVFGGSVPEVTNDLAYHLEYRGQKTRDFKVSVFEHPRLTRSDVDLTFPKYTGLPPKHIEDTRRVSAVEGTKLDVAFQLNKPVASAKLVTRDAKKTAIPLTVLPGQAKVTLPGFVPEKSQAYDLQLVDAAGRPNKVAASIVIEVQPNRPPELKLASPRGDVRPSALEEVTFDGTIFDDFGSPAYGLAYSVAGAEPKVIELGRSVVAKEKRAFNHGIKLEELGAKPDDLISWYVWADDFGPDGEVRRTRGDLYFAEVRPFDEIFRESQGMDGQDQQQPQQGGRGSQARRLTDLQKQVINATWKLQRDGASPKYPADSKVVSDAQAQALAQAQETSADVTSPRQGAMWKTVTQEMEKALDKLKAAAKEPGPLAQALPAEQAAYQALLKLQARETNVTRAGKGGGGGGGQQASQRQIDQLDLKQNENRYETQRQAKSPQNKERTEQLAVMNRLQELARRQQDLNERLKELQTSLQEAKTEQEREDIRKRLKRLEEEQRQMLADTDEVKQRMDRAENQSSMAQERQQLEQTREDLQKAAEAAASGSVAQALASGTRAQRQLQQLRDEMRKENSSQFAEDLRDMRSEARELAKEQEQITQKLDTLANAPTQRRSLSDTGERKEAQEKLAGQKDRMNKLVERATQVSEQAENSEPLLSRQLYDSIRKLSQDDASSLKQMRQELLSSGMMTRDLYERLQKAAESEKGGKALDLTREMLREGFMPQANQAGQRAKAEIDELRKGVERAAESVLGDDAEQLKLAQSELEQLTEQLQREIAQATGGGGKDGKADGQSGAADGKGEKVAASDQQKSSDQQPGQRGQDGQPGGTQASNQPQDGTQAGGQQAGGAQGGPAQGQAQTGAQAGNSGQPRAGTPKGQPQPGGRGQMAGGGGGGGGARGGRNQAGGNRGGLSVDNILNGGADAGGGGYGGGAWNGGGWAGGPLTGEDFNRWTERLSDVEQLLDTPELRNAVAAARERARLLRREFRTDLKKPDWAVVNLQVVKPLVEVRNRVAEELARRDPKDSLAPIDRDPVPNRYAESVRKYYEELGKDK